VQGPLPTTGSRMGTPEPPCDTKSRPHPEGSFRDKRFGRTPRGCGAERAEALVLPCTLLWAGPARAPAPALTPPASLLSFSGAVSPSAPVSTYRGHSVLPTGSAPHPHLGGTQATVVPGLMGGGEAAPPGLSAPPLAARRIPGLRSKVEAAAR
jgi:hypothetical protein